MSEKKRFNAPNAYQQGYSDALEGKDKDEYFKQFDGYVQGYNTGLSSLGAPPRDDSLIERLKEHGLTDYEIEGFMQGMEDAKAGIKRKGNYKAIHGYAEGYTAGQEYMKPFEEMKNAISRYVSKHLSTKEKSETSEEFEQIGNESHYSSEWSEGEEQPEHKRRKHMNIKLFYFFLLNSAITGMLLFAFSTKEKPPTLPPSPPTEAVRNDPWNVVRVLPFSNGKWGFLDAEGEVLVEGVYDDILLENYTTTPPLDTFIAKGTLVKREGKWGFADKRGKEVIPPTYDDVKSYKDGTAWVQLNGLWGLINREGEVLAPPQYQLHPEYYEFYNGFATLMKNNKWGAISKEGKAIVPFKYDNLGIFNSNGIAWAIDNGRLGLINSQGEQLPTPPLDMVTPRDNGFLLERNESLGFANASGRVVIPCEYSSIETTDNGFLVEQEGNHGFFDFDGGEKVPCRYESVTLQTNGFLVQEGDRSGFYDRNGTLVIPCRYNSLSFRDEGILAEDDGSYGLFSHTGEVIIPCKYDEIKIEGANYARVKLYGMYGWYSLINKAVAIPIQYDYVWGKFESVNDIVKVRLNGEQPIKIDYYGRTVEGKDIGEWFNEKVRTIIKKNGDQ